MRLRILDSDLQDLARTVAEMGGLAEKQISEAMEALNTRDSERACRVIATDAAMDAMQRTIEERTVETIARRQPVANDLRQIVGILRIANELDWRSGEEHLQTHRRHQRSGDSTQVDARREPVGRPRPGPVPRCPR